MRDPHLDRTCDPHRQTDLLYSFESYSDGFLDPLILNYNTTKQPKKKTTNITKPPNQNSHATKAEIP